jgi:hypothetical protein
VARIPDLLLFGAPSCAATALHEYRKQHPPVFLPDVKEPLFGTLSALVGGDPVLSSTRHAGNEQADFAVGVHG